MSLCAKVVCIQMDTKLRQLERRWNESGVYDDCKAYAISLQRSGIKTLEVTDGHPEDLLNYFWPKVTYRGIECMDLLSGLDRLGVDAHDRREYDYHQECFLGWLPEQDWIVIGWDAERTEHHECDHNCEEECDERDEDLSFGLARMYYIQPPEPRLLELHGLKGVYMNCKDTVSSLGGFYGCGNGLLRVLKEKYPTMIGLRYD